MGKNDDNNNSRDSTKPIPVAAATTKRLFSSSALWTTAKPLPPRDSIYVWSSLFAGVGSGAIASVVCAPLDLIRTRMQVWGEVMGGNGAKLPLWNVFRDIVHREGYLGCFRGLGATLLTVPAFWGVYFSMYDETKRYWHHCYPETKPALIHCGSAILAGAVSDLICNPMFVIRTRLQTEALHSMASKNNATSKNQLSMARTAVLLYQEGGWRIFWRGMAANLLGLSHVGVQFPAYEYLKACAREHRGSENCSAVDLLLASGVSKMTASLLTYPHEVVRSRMMDSRGSEGMTLFTAIRRIHASEGLLGFYSGLHISLIRVLPNCCITFMTYELLLRWARDQIQERQWNRKSSSSSTSTALVKSS